MTDNDKENIKNAVLEIIAKQNLNPVELAEQACKAIEFINNHPIKGGVMTGTITLKIN